jgi:hypothetical protein
VRTQARRVEAVGARLRVGLEPADGFVEVGPPDEEAFGAPDQQRIAAGLVDGVSCGANPLDRGVELEKGSSGIAGRIFYGKAGHSALEGKANAFRNAGRIGCEAALEVRIDRQIRRRDHFMKVRERHVARNGAIGSAARPGEAGARGGERLEAEALQETRASHVPRVRNDEAAGLVQLSKGATLVGAGGSIDGHRGVLTLGQKAEAME